MSYDTRRIEINCIAIWVSIPLEQGSVLRRKRKHQKQLPKIVSIPLEQGSVLRHKKREGKICSEGLNPFGTGQCLTTAVGSSSLVRQGLPKPLPNFFRDSESWGLIWLNVEQILTFHLHIKRSKTWSILPEF